MSTPSSPVNQQHHSDPQNPNPSSDSDPQNPNPNSNSDSDPLQQNQQSVTPDDRDPQSPTGLNPQEPSNPDQEPNQLVQEPEVVEVAEHEDPEPEGESMNLSSPFRENLDTHVGEEKDNPPPTVTRRVGKRKKGSFRSNKRKQAALEKKLQVLSQNFNPIPFVPVKSLEFSRYEEHLKCLGLWEFAHIELERNLRVDLISQLIVNYSPRASSVNGYRISLSRADLGRALKLPSKKSVGCDVEEFPAEFLWFLDDFVSNWMLLHEDTWMMPNEILNWTRMIKDGHPEKVDWAGLVWFMVEKELAQGPQLVNCYYASHLQRMIKVQKEELLRESPMVEVALEEDEDGGDVKMGGCDDQNVELSLGQDRVSNVEEVDKAREAETINGVNNMENEDGVHKEDDAENVESVDNAPKEEIKDDDMMDFENCKEEEQQQWPLKETNDEAEPLLQRCSIAQVKVGNDEETRHAEDEQLRDDEVAEDEPVEGFNVMQKCNTLDGLSSGNLIQAMETGQMYNASEFCDPTSLELLSSRTESNVMLSGSSMFNNATKRETGQDHNGGPSMFNDVTKREIGQDHDISHHDLNDDHRRMRIDGPWDHKATDLDTCMEQIMHWVGKARMTHEADKEHVFQQSNMNQMLINELENRDHMIQQLKCKLDELQRRRQAEIHRLDKELFLMSSVIDGYRKALKETHRKFAEYRKRSPLLEEPMYRDAGPGGIVKSIGELERERIKREEEERLMRITIEETLRSYQNDWEMKFKEHLAVVHSQDSKLLNLANEMGTLKEVLSKQKASEIAPAAE